MARNEEKQLARLNRFYLQQSKEEELIKRPPRPKLDSLCTVDEVKKWIPSILSDIDFYTKQMEVTCYPQRVIDDFNQRIGRLRGEYKAFVRKIKNLEPDLDSTPWTDRPYNKRSKVDQREKEESSTQEEKLSNVEFKPLETPILKKDPLYDRCYGYSDDFASLRKCENSEELSKPHLDESCQNDQPLEFIKQPSKLGVHCESTYSLCQKEKYKRSDLQHKPLPKWLQAHTKSVTNKKTIGFQSTSDLTTKSYSLLNHALDQNKVKRPSSQSLFHISESFENKNKKINLGDDVFFTDKKLTLEQQKDNTTCSLVSNYSSSSSDDNS